MEGRGEWCQSRQLLCDAGHTASQSFADTIFSFHFLKSPIISGLTTFLLPRLCLGIVNPLKNLQLSLKDLQVDLLTSDRQSSCSTVGWQQAGKLCLGKEDQEASGRSNNTESWREDPGLSFPTANIRRWEQNVTELNCAKVVQPPSLFVFPQSPFHR